MIEAAQHGVPTIGYRSSGGLSDSIVDGVTGMLVDDVDDLVDGLQRLLTDHVLRSNSAPRPRCVALNSRGSRAPRRCRSCSLPYRRADGSAAWYNCDDEQSSSSKSCTARIWTRATRMTSTGCRRSTGRRSGSTTHRWTAMQWRPSSPRSSRPSRLALGGQESRDRRGSGLAALHRDRYPSGPYLGVPATNRRVAITQFTLYRVEDGLFADVWDLADMAAIPGQLS